MYWNPPIREEKSVSVNKKAKLHVSLLVPIKIDEVILTIIAGTINKVSCKDTETSKNRKNCIE